MQTYTNGSKKIRMIEEENTLNNQLGYRTYIDGIKDAWVSFDLVEAFLKRNLGSFWKESDLVPNPK